MRAERGEGEVRRVCAYMCTLAGRRRSGANDNLSHKERKRKSAERKERGAETCEWWARVGKKDEAL